MNLQVDQDLDVCGLSCPMPLLKAKQALNRLESGSVLRVIATDPSSERDFKVFSEQSGIPLLHATREDDRFMYWLQKP
jgi:tRNA 2-thiouridine synthesizing protein A